MEAAFLLVQMDEEPAKGKGAVKVTREPGGCSFRKPKGHRFSQMTESYHVEQCSAKSVGNVRKRVEMGPLGPHQ